MKGRVAWITLLGIGLLGLFAGCAVGGSAPACAPPGLEAEPARAAPGENFRLHGEGFFVGCNDTGQNRPMSPDRNIRIDLRQGERTWRLATVDARENYSFDAKLRVPADAGRGRAVLVASGKNGTVRAAFRVPGDESLDWRGL